MSVTCFVSKCQETTSISYSIDFEADLQEVWSVRKNIHHNNRARNSVSGIVPSSLSVPKFNHQSYSRHGALAPQQAETPHGISVDSNSGKKTCPFSPQDLITVCAKNVVIIIIDLITNTVY